MPTIKNVFTGGKMSKDVDERLLKKGECRHAQNIRIANSNGSDVGAIEKSLSNRQLTGLNLGTNVKTIGGVADEFEEKLYWLVKSDLGCFIIEYDTINQLASFVLKDTRIGDKNVLALDENYLVTGIAIIVDTDNNNRFLIYTDNNTQPKCINIERAKTYGENGFDEEMILLIKKPPIFSPKIELKKNLLEEGNNIETVFLRFGYRYIYLDGERSAISPLSNVAFSPKRFEYNFNYSSNEGMINDFNKVKIIFNSGGALVTDVEIIFIEDGKNIPYLINSFNKKNKGWDNNKEYSTIFSNSKIFKNLSEKQLYRLYDNIPLKAKSLDIVDNRIIFGNYTENYDLKDKYGNDIFPAFSLLHYKNNITSLTAVESCKTNREYEVAIVYIDEYGRMTTPLISENNTVFINNKHIDKQNYLAIHLTSYPPFWAKYYRFFIKQNRSDYDIIIPNDFYDEGGFTWIGVKDKDADKLKEEDYLIVKTDTQGIKKRLVKAKVLQIEKKKEEGKKGWYFKTVSDSFRLNKEDANIYTHKGSNRSSSKPEQANSYVDTSGTNTSTNTPVSNIVVNTSGTNTTTDNNYSSYTPINNYIEKPVYYGVNYNNADRLNSSGSCSGNDKRYLIEIDFAEEEKDCKFRWSLDNGSTWKGETIEITGEEQLLEEGVKISFLGKRGFSLTDKWIVSAKGVWKFNNYRANAYFYPEQDFIPVKTKMVFSYRGTIDQHPIFNLEFETTKNYANLEEWYYGDKAYEKIEPLLPSNRNIRFRRGVVVKEKLSNSFYYFKQDSKGVVCLIINGDVADFGDGNYRQGIGPAYAHWTFSVINFKNIPIFETESHKENDDVFYEIGRTYKIENGVHKASNHITYGSKDYGVRDEEYNTSLHFIPFFNCYSWGNGFESIKIKDLFNANTLSIQTRPSVPVENYRQNKRIASLTYGKQYDQSLNYNGLNEFNMSELNFKDLDDKYGAIQRIMSYNTDLDVWQEDKVHRVLYGKSTLYNEDGSGNVGKSDMILGTVVPYAGEFGISTHPESLVAFGNYRYWVDAKRGVVVRKGQSGIEIISKHGMRDWFRDFLGKNYRKPIFGAYDPYYGQYTISLEVDDRVVAPNIFDEKERTIESQTTPYIYYFQLNDLTGDIKLDYNVLKGKATISLEYGEKTEVVHAVSGAGVLSLYRNDFNNDKVKVSIIPVSNSIDFTFKNTKPTGEHLEVIRIFLHDPNLAGYSTQYYYDYGNKEDTIKRRITFRNAPWSRRGSYQLLHKGGLHNNRKILIAAHPSTRAKVKRLGYYITDKNLLPNEGIAELTKNAVFLEFNHYVYPLDGIIFNFENPNRKKKLYLIWDYRTP